MEQFKVNSYSRGSKIFHWIIALIVLIMLTGSFFLDDLPKAYEGEAIMLHKSFGLTILFLMVLRILWLISTGRPELPVTMPTWQKKLARIVQHSLYLFLFLMPAVGWMMSTAAGRNPSFFGIMTLPFPGIPIDKSLSHLLFTTHQIIAWILIVLITVHVAGALKHWLIDKDEVMRTMWFS